MHHAIKQFTRFFIVGVLNTAIDFGIYVGLTRLLNVPYVIATVIAVSVATLVAYLAHKNISFRNTDPHSAEKVIKFFVVSGGGLAINAGILFAGTQIYHYYDILVKVAATGIVMFWSFFMHKYWTFRA